MSITFHCTSFFKFSYNFYGYTLQLLYDKFYVQFDQFEKVKQSVSVPCIIYVPFYHQIPLTEMNVVFIEPLKTTNIEMFICLYSIQSLYITWNSTNDGQRNSQKFV